MAVPLYFDHDVDQRIVPALRARGYDFLTASEDGTARTSDERILVRATRLGRIVFTHNRGDFRRIHHRWAARSMAHAGILTATMIRRDLVLARLLAFLNHETADSVANRLISLHTYDRFLRSR